jgi:hypothetical protein
MLIVPAGSSQYVDRFSISVTASSNSLSIQCLLLKTSLVLVDLCRVSANVSVLSVHTLYDPQFSRRDDVLTNSLSTAQVLLLTERSYPQLSH